LICNRSIDVQVWGCDIIVDWADPQEEPDEQTMSKVSYYLSVCDTSAEHKAHLINIFPRIGEGIVRAEPDTGNNRRGAKRRV
jgi:hypothetical protein